MKKINISNARNKLYKIVSSCIKNKDVFKIGAKEGNVIMISEDDYNNSIESLYLAVIKDVYRDIERTIEIPISEFSDKSPWN